MKTVTMYKFFDPDKLFGGYKWLLRPYNENGNYSEPFLVEIPEDFHLKESFSGETIYFRGDSNMGYKLCTLKPNDERCSPYLIGGCPVEKIRLHVIGLYK